ncbi:hypothetical protein [Marinilactibacillus sp. Marseille-P9653]|uniref:hypothetical protein n=1 Tax=Marinilactibacillus sp. Marseille-P9653 TaxID=2866583 RepID=UPI001CE41623|nr:hypothetical protein [Marinilactibacillus sp. Marseille-P9653]
MVEYDGPSFFKHVKHQSTLKSTKRLKANLEQKQPRELESKENLFSEEHTHSLPNQIQSRGEVEKGFQQYLEEKRTTGLPNRSKHYIEPPFEVSKVPSPIYGFKKPVKKEQDHWNYERLKETLKKASNEFLLFEEFETAAPIADWNFKEKQHQSQITIQESTESTNKVNQDQIESSKKETKQDAKKRMRLHRSLMNIIQEEQLGANKSKREIPGFFSDKNE